MIVWEIYSNKIPFADSVDSAKEYVADKKSRPKIGASIPEHIRNIIEKWWWENPTDRYQSMDEIEKELF